MHKLTDLNLPIPLFILISKSDERVSNCKAIRTLIQKKPPFNSAPIEMHAFPDAPHELLFWDKTLKVNTSIEKKQKAKSAVIQANKKLDDFFYRTGSLLQGELMH